MKSVQPSIAESGNRGRQTANVLSVRDRNALNNLDYVVRQSLRSKPSLRLLSQLQSRGLINFDPFGGTASLTEAGRAALAGAK